MRDDSATSGCLIYSIAGLICVACVALSISIAWYRAGLQAAVYKRQGITLSHWEVFCGVKPAESVVQIKERP